MQGQLETVGAGIEPKGLYEKSLVLVGHAAESLAQAAETESADLIVKLIIMPFFVNYQRFKNRFEDLGNRILDITAGVVSYTPRKH